MSELSLLNEKLVQAVKDAFCPRQEQPTLSDEESGWTGGELEGDARTAVAAVLREMASWRGNHASMVNANFFPTMAAELEKQR